MPTRRPTRQGATDCGLDWDGGRRTLARPSDYHGRRTVASTQARGQKYARPMTLQARIPSDREAPGFAFRLELTVSARDIDRLGHANNVAYVQWIQDVAVAHSHSIGLDWDAYQ